MVQLRLFGNEPAPGEVAAAVVSEEVQSMAAQLPANIRFGTSSWSFPGWRGFVWGDNTAIRARSILYSEAALAKHGLGAYTKHPLLRAVGVDRTHYAPVEAAVLAQYALTVPADFRFLCKAHEATTLAVFPNHPRYGGLRNQSSPHFLDANYARDLVIAPFAEGLGANAGTLLFQFAAQPIEQLGGSPRLFAERLFRFLRDLPKLPAHASGQPRYAVEIRQRALLTKDYAAALRATDSVHCFNALPGMPSLPVQRSIVGDQPTAVIRWMLAQQHTYQTALSAYGDFTRLVDPDLQTRRHIADHIRMSVARGHDTLVIVNNKAEGSAPLSIVELARELCADFNDQPPF
jgi:uncharacterized protein YecE (DUF72 family)